jgi:predicted HAD superfamily Cof-like phosphohydrolase
MLDSDPDLVRLRARLIREEFEEVMAELGKLARATSPERRLEVHLSLLKELADLRYVVEGAAVSFGLDIDGAFAEVHRSNMTKLGADGKPVYREDGKVIKGPNYREADMRRVVPLIYEHEGDPEIP